MDKRNINFTNLVHPLTGHPYIDDIEDESSPPPPLKNTDTRPAPHWLDGPRDVTTLPDIIASTYSDYGDEADYAMKQMLAILETLNPGDETMELFENALKAIQFRLPFDIIQTEEKKPDWPTIRHKLITDSLTISPLSLDSDQRRGLSSAQMSSVFDAIPFLFDAVACNPELRGYQNVLSMIVMIAMTGNSMIRRQSINAIQALMERSMLSQEFMRDGVVPGLFHIYQSGVGTFQSNDLRMECVQALCQVISYDTIHDRRWLFINFLPRFSQMLKDTTMHVRKSALHIFGNLGTIFGEKFTEVFLVPHLVTLSCDMTWAVRKVVCEVFVKVAECASHEVRVETLSPNFVRLLNDPNKWVSFIAYQQLGPFISLFANPDITGYELKNGKIVVRPPVEPQPTSDEPKTPTETNDEFGTLPPNTWLPELDISDDLEYQLAMMESNSQAALTTTPIAKTPKRGERVMDSVLSGINKMFGQFERSPKSKEPEKIAATFSSPSKRSTISLHGAVSLMDKWSKRSNPNNPQRFGVFDSTASLESKEQNGGTGIAAKCNSTDDLTKLGLEDDDMGKKRTSSSSSSSSDEDSDNEEEPDFDKTFVADEETNEEDDEDAPLTIDCKSSTNGGSSESVSRKSGDAKEPENNEFSLTYWSSNYATVSIEDELKPFGSSSSFTNSPTSNSYLESRFDVMKSNAASPRARSQSFGTSGSPIAMSPRRKANSTSESSPPTTAALETSKSDDSVVMITTEEKEKLGILDIDDLNMSLSSNSSIHGEAAMTEESDISMISLENSVFQHVPMDLVESYMKVMGPSSNQGAAVTTGDPSLCAEIYRHCAHNFPAVCYTLGAAAWPKLKLIFRKLAMDEQARVRQSISYSIHEIANMLGTEITDEDLLPVFYELRNDQNMEVRNGILLHLYDFVKCLSPEKRDDMILSLPQFFPIGAQPGNQTQNGDWRSRFELISQLSKLCSLYSTQAVNFHMSGIALTLADDRVAEVRREAVMLVSTIVGALVAAEWEEIRATRDIENGHLDMKTKKEKASSFLSEQFVDDIVSSFAKTQKWTRRQTFCFICAQILRDKQCDGIQFRYFFATPLQQLVQDRVPNVRLASCEALSVWRKTLIAARSQERRGPSPVSSPSSEPSTFRRDINMVSDMMVRLSNDSDIDAAYLAKKCQGLTDDQQPIDVEGRTNRMREREELYFGDLILTDATGCLVRVVGKEVTQVIKRPIQPSEVINVPVETEKEAPIQTMEEFDDEILKILQNETESMNISTPPEVMATIERIENEQFHEEEVDEQEKKDNTDIMDMEVDSDEEQQNHEQIVDEVASSCEGEVAHSEEVGVPMEGDVPMDPAPSTRESPKEDDVIITTDESEA